MSPNLHGSAKRVVECYKSNKEIRQDVLNNDVAAVARSINCVISENTLHHFLYAAKSVKMLRLLVDNGAKPDVYTVDNYICFGRVEQIKFLLDSGLDVTSERLLGNPLRSALVYKKFEIAQILLEAGTKITLEVFIVLRNKNDPKFNDLFDKYISNYGELEAAADALEAKWKNNASDKEDVFMDAAKDAAFMAPKEDAFMDAPKEAAPKEAASKREDLTNPYCDLDCFTTEDKECIKEFVGCVMDKDDEFINA